MIHEYAVDPAVVRGWDTFKFAADGFGMSKGRMIAEYPKDWRRHAYDATKGLGQQTVHAITTWLQDRARKALTKSRRSRPFTERTFLENAVDEHRVQPFRAIVVKGFNDEDPPILDYHDAVETNPKWAAPRQVYVGRDANMIGGHVREVLRYAQQIRFIDPFFMANPDQVRIMLSCLSCFDAALAANVQSIEIHVDGIQVAKPTEQHVLGQLRARWPVGLPAATIVRWQNGYLHNRFVLTELGGVSLGDSIHEHDERPDQITLLEDHVHQQWWRYHDPVVHPDKLSGL